jgi:D-threo-aldose 1-dehydrogenase
MHGCELGLGTAEIGNLYRVVSDTEAEATLRAATQAGLTLFDTAPFYGHGLSETRLGAYLRGLPRHAYRVSTKIGHVLTAPVPGEPPASVFMSPLPFTPIFDYSYDGTMRALEQSRRRLGTQPDFVFVHDLDRRNLGETFDAHRRVASAGAIRALSELRASGDIGAMGIAVNEADIGTELLAEADFDCALLAGQYTLLDHAAVQAFLPAAQARRVAVFAGGVFNSGILATGAVPGARYAYLPAPGPIRARVRAMQAICARYDVPLAAAALQFVAAHPAIDAIILGASQPHNVARACAAMALQIPPVLWQDMHAQGLLPAECLDHVQNTGRLPTINGGGPAVL